MFSPLEQFDVKPIIILNFYNYELTFFDILFPMIITSLLFIYIYNLKNNQKLIPSSTQYFFEKLLKFIFTIIKNQIGENGYKYIPFITTIFIFVLFANLLSLLPFGVSLTSHLIVILWNFTIIRSSNINFRILIKRNSFFKNIYTNMSNSFIAIIIIIEIFSYIIRCLALQLDYQLTYWLDIH